MNFSHTVNYLETLPVVFRVAPDILTLLYVKAFFFFFPHSDTTTKCVHNVGEKNYFLWLKLYIQTKFLEEEAVQQAEINYCFAKKGKNIGGYR